MTATNTTPTTVAEFIEFLKTQPQNAIVEILKGTVGNNYEPDSYEFAPVDFSEQVDFTDFTQYEFVKEGHPYFGKKVVRIGEKA